MGDYAVAPQALWAKTNAAPGTLSALMLRDAFSNGLHPASHQRNIKRFVRERPESPFATAKTEALRWMKEDSSSDVATEQLTSINNAVLTRMEAQLAALTAQTTSLKQQLQESATTLASHHRHRQQAATGTTVSAVNTTDARR